MNTILTIASTAAAFALLLLVLLFVRMRELMPKPAYKKIPF